MKDLIDRYIATEKVYKETKERTHQYLLSCSALSTYNEQEYHNHLKEEARLKNELKKLENEITEKLREDVYFEIDNETVLTVCNDSDEFQCVVILKKYKEET